MTPWEMLIFATRADVLLAAAFGIGIFLWLIGKLDAAKKVVWGDINSEEMLKFGILSVASVIVLGSYWSVRVLKESLFFELVGKNYYGPAKIITFPIVIGLVFIYNLLLNRVNREQLFWVVSGAYAAMFVAIGYFYSHPFAPMTGPFFDLIPGRMLGWIIFNGIESYGGIVVTMFFSYVTFTTTTAAAKRGLGLIFFAAQIGQYAGPTIGDYFLSTIGFANLFYGVAAVVMMIPVTIAAYVAFVSESMRTSDSQAGDKKKTGVFEGLRLLAQHPYLVGLAVVSTVYEIVAVVLDMQFKLMAGTTYNGVDLASYLSQYAKTGAVVAIVFSFAGTSFVIRKLGVRWCLLVFPATVALIISYIKFNPILNIFFFGMIIFKTLAYTLNSPVKEMMFIPTSKDVKFKVKSVTDTIGGKGSKAIGAGVISLSQTLAAGGAAGAFLLYTSMISLGVVGMWLMVAMWVGKKYDKLITSKEIIQ